MSTEAPTATAPGKQFVNRFLLVLLSVIVVVTAIDIWGDRPRVNPFQCVVGGSALSALMMHLGRYYVLAQPWSRILKTAAIVTMAASIVYFLMIAVRGG